MNINYYVSFLDRVMSWFPCRSRHYVKKWISLRSDVNLVDIWSDNTSRRITMFIDFKRDNQNPYTYICPAPLLVFGTSMRDMWRKCLNTIAEYENMRNADELCIWLDMKDI